MTKRSFSSWLTRQEDRDDPVGDFATDTIGYVLSLGHGLSVLDNKDGRAIYELLGLYKYSFEVKRAFVAAYEEYLWDDYDESFEEIRESLMEQYPDEDWSIVGIHEEVA